jgi:hypothetical protein
MRAISDPEFHFAISVPVTVLQNPWLPEVNRKHHAKIRRGTMNAKTGWLAARSSTCCRRSPLVYEN